jgi:homopolymeric O-antigen transport system ATP-binding protein
VTAPATMPAIEVRGLTKHYHIFDRPADRLRQTLSRRKRHFRAFAALDDVSFTVAQGETVGIIGRNGSGKSTLLQIVCGTMAPTSGQVGVRGRVAALLELGSGFNPEFTGRENVIINGMLYGLTRAQIAGRMDEIARFADIGDFLDQPVKTYSSGMMVRLAFAVIAHVDADILIIDEALAVGDVFFVQKCMRFLRNFMTHGTVLFVSHDTNAVLNLCSYAVWLENGKVRQAGSPKEICENYLAALYEQSQGPSAVPNPAPTGAGEDALSGGDRRPRDVNETDLRGDVQLSSFDPTAKSFGTGDARITEARFLDEAGNPLSWVVGGEIVTVRVTAVANSDLRAPIVGFSVKDRLGQILFGDNTYLSHRTEDRQCAGGRAITAQFTFQCPILPAGDYTITAAIADGTQENHTLHHWIYDAVQFKSTSSNVATGLIGIPMLDISLTLDRTIDAPRAQTGTP